MISNLMYFQWEILISGDLIQGRSNISVINVIDHRNTINIIEICGSHQTLQNVTYRDFKIGKVEIQMHAMTLRMRSRSNMWYVQKCLTMGDILTP